MSQDKKTPGCVKYGCIGCLSVLALGVGLVFLVSVVQFTAERTDPEPVQRELVRELPEPPRLPGRPVGDQPAIPEVRPLPEAVELPEAAVRAGRLVLDLQMGDFVIRPGPANEPIRVEADYDEGRFNLSEEFTESDTGEWTYEVSFGSPGGFLGMLFRGGSSSGDNQIEITIPRGHPIDIVGSVALGELEADLSGLWVRRVDLDLGAGDHFIEFREPSPFPMESFRSEMSTGAVEVRGLGQASPKEVEVAHSIGELFLDLKGTWRNDAAVDVDFGIGECRVWLPDEVHVDVQRAKVGIGEDYVERPDGDDIPADAPTVTLNLSSSIGEVRVEY